jgi:F-type H+-transporting ATPase subunit a
LPSTPIFAANLETDMSQKSMRFLLIAVFSLFVSFFSNSLIAQETPSNAGENKEETGKINPSKIILEHVSDAHEFHFATVGNKPVSIPLPVILYSPAKGFYFFMSSAFHHGKEVHDGYLLMTEEFLKEHGLEHAKDKSGQPLYKEEKIYATDVNGMPDLQTKVYDFSLTRNATQMLVSVILLTLIMTSIAKKYRKGQGVKTAPTGFQNVIEPVITFIRDEVAKPNLGKKYEPYMPLLLSIFFFILINTLIGLIPGTATVTGNIAFTGVLGIISFIVILFSSNKHFWGHIVNPPVPGGVKPIMIPVEIMGLFTKPFALIIRLFANMISGHIIILSFICLIFIFGAMNTALGFGTSPFFVLLAVFIYLIEILVAFIQAFIFANLTAVFVGQAFEGGHDHPGVPGHDDPIVV